MASGDPKYGGTEGVDALDFGQPGGTLALASQAVAAMLATISGPQISENMLQIPELSAQFQHVGGYAGQTLTLAGYIYADTDARLDTIEAEIGSYRDGHLRNPVGTMTLKLDRLKPTRLTMPWANGTDVPIWPLARLVDYQQTGPRKGVAAGQWGAAQPCRITFQRMKS